MVDLNWRQTIVEEQIQEDNMRMLENQYRLELSLLNSLLARNDHTSAGIEAFERQFKRVNEAAARLREAQKNKSVNLTFGT